MVCETITDMDVGDEPPWTTHMDVGSVPKRRERVGAGFTACLAYHYLIPPPKPKNQLNTH
jgi:hypothetical protein